MNRSCSRVDEYQETNVVSVNAIGTKVLIGGEVPAVVTAVTLRSTGVSYEVAWWSENTRNTAWVEPCELTVAAEGLKPLRVGFLSE